MTDPASANAGPVTKELPPAGELAAAGETVATVATVASGATAGAGELSPARESSAGTPLPPTPPAPSARRDLRVRLTRRERLSRDAHLLHFAPAAGAGEGGTGEGCGPGNDSEADFENNARCPTPAPGQFTMIRLAGAGLLRRPYSYCDRIPDSAPDGAGFTLLVKEFGAGSRALARLEPGGEADSLGPLGTVFLPPPSSRTPVLVAGGVGIAPFVLFCRRLAEAGRRALVLLGGRTAEDLYLRDTFAGFGMEVRGATEDGSVGHRGFVTDLLDRALADAGDPALYSCGPTGMLLRVAETGRTAGVPHQVSIERRMGCGMGCCLGCVVWAAPDAASPPEYLRSCTEGPVFDASRIAWDRDPHPL